MTEQKHLYEFEDYKEYLNYRCGLVRGLKSSLAEAVAVQSAYVSQVLNDNSHLSLEQGDLANQFFKHSEKESRYFLLILQKEKAGTVSLKKFFQKQVDEFLKEEFSYLKKNEIKNSLSSKDQAQYYSSWEYNVLHMAVTIPRLRTKEALMTAFAMGEKKFNLCMEFLIESGLVRRSGGQFIPGTIENYLAKDSPFVRQLHLNSRALAISSLSADSELDAHYSGSLTLSMKDAIKVKKLLSDCLSEIAETTKHSKEENIFGFVIDFYNIEKTSE